MEGTNPDYPDGLSTRHFGEPINCEKGDTRNIIKEYRVLNNTISGIKRALGWNYSNTASWRGGEDRKRQVQSGTELGGTLVLVASTGRP